MTELKPYQWLDANQLKLIAIVAMTVDHIAWLLFPGYAAGAVPIVMHIIGRITCPVMCFSLRRASTIPVIGRSTRCDCSC